jgi:hypothetical protein
MDIRGRGDFYRSMCYLHANRAAAFRRSYVVADDGAWGMPIIARLHALHAAGVSLGHTEVAADIGRLVRERQGAVMADRVRLVRYGAHMSHYCARLQLILRTLSATVPAVMAVARFPHDPEGFVLPVRVEQTYPLEELTDEAADLIVKARLDVERREVAAALQAMEITYSDALIHVHAITRGIRVAMGTDGHCRHQTCFLHGSPSLKNAHYAACIYASAMGAE